MSASSSDTQSSLPVHWVQWSTCPPPRSTHSCALFVMSRTALLTVALSRLSSNGLTSRKIERLIPAQPNFHTLYKSEQCSFKHELFLDVLVSDESWDHKLSIHVNHSPQNQIFFIRQPFQKCIVFFETHGIPRLHLLITDWKLSIDLIMVFNAREVAMHQTCQSNDTMDPLSTCRDNVQIINSSWYPNYLLSTLPWRLL